MDRRDEDGPLEDWEVEMSVTLRIVVPVRAHSERHAHYLALTSVSPGMSIPLDQKIIKRKVQR